MKRGFQSLLIRRRYTHTGNLVLCCFHVDLNTAELAAEECMYILQVCEYARRSKGSEGHQGVPACVLSSRGEEEIKCLGGGLSV